mgnify:CR=1 FL=1
MKGEAGEVWHRMGDVGWLDDEGRLWFCGRKSERVITEQGVLFTECVEGIVNAVPGVYRSALVGVSQGGEDLAVKQPLVVLELDAGVASDQALRDVKEALARRPMTENITEVRVHKTLPVDIRHNAKIKRQDLAKLL